MSDCQSIGQKIKMYWLTDGPQVLSITVTSPSEYQLRLQSTSWVMRYSDDFWQSDNLQAYLTKQKDFTERFLKLQNAHRWVLLHLNSHKWHLEELLGTMHPRWAIHFSGNAFQWEHYQKVREVIFRAFSLKLSPGEGKTKGKGMEGQGKRGGYPPPFRFSGYTHVANITWLQAGTDKNSQSMSQPYNSKYRPSHFVHMVQRLSMHLFAIMHLVKWGHAEMRVLQLILYTYAKSNCSGLDKYFN